MSQVLRLKGGMVCSDRGTLEKGDVWVQDGKIIDPLKLFYEDRRAPDCVIDCSDLIVAPGFIDIQINGAFGVDFSSMKEVKRDVDTVSRGLLQHGVTAYCPTLVTSSRDYYHRVLPSIRPTKGGPDGAAVLGVHCEGPFINREKKGAHQEAFIQGTLSPSLLNDCYENLENVRIITVAPELEGGEEVISWLTREKEVIVSLGHSMSSLSTAERAVRSGASLITHLFNAMLPFHHRDPGLVGLLTTLKLEKKQVYYGIIADGYHTDETVLRIAYNSNPAGIVLVTDAIAAMGLGEGLHQLGTMSVEVKDRAARLPGKETLAGSCSTMVECVRELMRATDCSCGEALLAASKHPAKALGLDGTKGSVERIGADADMVLLDSELHVHATCIAGGVVWIDPENQFSKRIT